MSLRLESLAMAGAVAAMVPFALAADDYFLAAGESDSITEAATYANMTVNGDLSVSGNDLYCGLCRSRIDGRKREAIP